MKNIIPGAEHSFQSQSIAQVINLEDEKKIEKEVEALIDLHDFIKAHPDSPVKEIARFMPPVDARVVNKAIQALAVRDKTITAEEKEAIVKRAQTFEAPYAVKKWGKRGSEC